MHLKRRITTEMNIPEDILASDEGAFDHEWCKMFSMKITSKVLACESYFTL